MPWSQLYDIDSIVGLIYKEKGQELSDAINNIKILFKFMMLDFQMYNTPKFFSNVWIFLAASSKVLEERRDLNKALNFI